LFTESVAAWKLDPARMLVRLFHFVGDPRRAAATLSQPTSQLSRLTGWNSVACWEEKATSRRNTKDLSTILSTVMHELRASGIMRGWWIDTASAASWVTLSRRFHCLCVTGPVHAVAAAPWR
jgi:hypothetical protein